MDFKEMHTNHKQSRVDFWKKVFSFIHKEFFIQTIGHNMTRLQRLMQEDVLSTTLSMSVCVTLKFGKR